jgi:hypothetical protein
MQRYTMVLITINTLHVSGGPSAHHQELKTVYTASGICRAFQLTHDSSNKQSFTYQLMHNRVGLKEY